MRRLLLLALFSLALSLVVSRLVMTSRFATIRAELKEACEPMSFGIAPPAHVAVAGQRPEEVAA